ncbi:unnamed protein product [Sphenostylis stenocarpa]|uniref:Uncharacterized protein n=1 Tax=Sphenostylis stenocarpa TaxID=92480 RepID=A0AA86SZU1_9FABA|nr:unnamed protein product [Sphenostylis stenocarpa]
MDAFVVMNDKVHTMVDCTTNWFDAGHSVQEELEKGLPRFLCGVTMDGKLCVMWEFQGNWKELEMWCAKMGVKKTPVSDEVNLVT